MNAMKKLLFIVHCSLFIIHSAPMRADDLSSVRSEIEAAQKQDKVLAGQIKDGEKIVSRTRQELVKTAGEISRLESEKSAVAGKIKVLEKKQSDLIVRIKETDKSLADASAALVAMGMSGARWSESDGADYALAMAALSAVAERFDADMKTAVRQVRELEKLSKDLEKEHGAYLSAEKKYKAQRSELDGLLRARANQNQALRGKQYELQSRNPGQ